MQLYRRRMHINIYKIQRSSSAYARAVVAHQANGVQLKTVQKIYTNMCIYRQKPGIIQHTARSEPCRVDRNSKQPEFIE